MKRLLPCLWVSLLLVCGSAFAAIPLPRDSVYQLNVQLTNQDGQVQTLAARRGRPQLVTMFYTSCTMVCPMIIDTIKMTRKALDEPARDQLDMLAVSFDPANDDVATLRQYADTRKLDTKHWTLARTEPQAVLQLAALLGVQYRQLPDGEFNHSSTLILLDAEGRIVARTDVIGRLDPQFVTAARKLLAATPALAAASPK
ncbi:MAG: SCO family protein [Rhodanobacter sp.]